MNRESVGAISAEEFLSIEKSPLAQIRDYNKFIIKRLNNIFTMLSSSDQSLPEEFTVQGVSVEEAEEIASRMIGLRKWAKYPAWYVVGGKNDPEKKVEKK